MEVNMQEYIKKQWEIIEKMNQSITLMMQSQTKIVNDIAEFQRVVANCVGALQDYMDERVVKDALQKIAKTEIDNKRTM